MISGLLSLPLEDQVRRWFRQGGIYLNKIATVLRTISLGTPGPEYPLK